MAVEKIWDALENLKTYFKDSAKKQVNQKVSDILSSQNEQISKIFEKELSELGNIGNNYHIRHYNDIQVQVTDSRHYDYFFNRCLSLVSLALQYLK
jgi:N-acetylneuraminic acid mutarotase